MATADNRLMTDATGQGILTALQNLAAVQAVPYVASIPTGQWSGEENDWYITINASNVTANSILIPNYDNDSLNLLKGPVWCVPAAGSFTIHTSAIPAGTVTIMVMFAGTMGEAQYQVLADVYSKNQTYSKDQVYTKTETNNVVAQSTAKEIISSLAVISGTPITIEKNNCYKYQSFAIVNIRIRVTGSISSGQIVLQGLPQMYGASLSSGSSAGAIASNKKRFSVDEYGQILTAEALSADDGMIVLSGMYAI